MAVEETRKIKAIWIESQLEWNDVYIYTHTHLHTNVKSNSSTYVFLWPGKLMLIVLSLYYRGDVRFTAYPRASDDVTRETRIISISVCPSVCLP